MGEVCAVGEGRMRKADKDVAAVRCKRVIVWKRDGDTAVAERMADHSVGIQDVGLRRNVTSVASKRKVESKVTKLMLTLLLLLLLLLMLLLRSCPKGTSIEILGATCRCDGCHGCRCQSRRSRCRSRWW